jgi:hypothetical protein
MFVSFLLEISFLFPLLACLYLVAYPVGSGTLSVMDELAASDKLRDQTQRRSKPYMEFLKTVSFSSLLRLPAGLQVRSFDLVDNLMTLHNGLLGPSERFTTLTRQSA